MTHRYLKNTVSLSLDVEKCTGCGSCVEVCPHAVFDVPENKAQIRDSDLCMECGACALNCLANAITVKAGVGCAAAIIYGWLTGSEPNCCGSDGDCCG